MNKYKSILVIILLSINYNSFCQTLEFISKTHKKNLSFKIGDNIGYAEKGFTWVKNGKIQAINDSSILVNGKTIRTEDISHIGLRKKGTSLITIPASAISGFALGYWVVPKDTPNNKKIVGLSIAIPLFTISKVVLGKNRLYKVRNKYQFEVNPE